ncbi:MAG: M15 family metallopeptidase [Paraclostridium sp.]
MTKYKFSKRSLSNIEGIDDRLVIVLGLMLELAPYDFVVTEGLRTLERQKQLVAEGKSKTMNSRHLNGKAFDIAILVSGSVTWDKKYYDKWASVFLDISKRLGFDVEWGGSWKSFVDCPHFQINN